MWLHDINDAGQNRIQATAFGIAKGGQDARFTPFYKVNALGCIKLADRSCKTPIYIKLYTYRQIDIWASMPVEAENLN